jgi:thioredoxin-like negative regulator of GroEL
MNPVVNGLQKEYDGQVTFNLVDIDLPDSRSLKQQYGFRAQPYFVLLDGDGNVTKTWYGIVLEDDFRKAFEALIPD